MKENKKTIGLLNWIKLYPKKALIFTLLIFIPIFIVSMSLVRTNRNAKRFYFDKNGDEPNYLYQKDVSKRKKFDEFFETFEIRLEEVSSYTQGANKYDKGRFKFNLDVSLNPIYKDANISYRYVLAANHIDAQSNTGSLSGKNTDFTINYPFNLPKHKMLLFKVNNPNLYVEVNISYETISSNITNTHKEQLIYKLDINKIKYSYEVND